MPLAEFIAVPIALPLPMAISLAMLMSIPMASTIGWACYMLLNLPFI